MRRDRRIILAVALISLLLTSGGLAGIYYYAQGEYRALRQKWGSWSHGDPIMIHDSLIGFSLNPGALSSFHVRGTERFVDVAANPQGLRVSPALRQTALSAADGVAIGCSFTFGHGVTAEEAYPSVAAKVSGLSVVNVGVQAYGTVGSLLALRRLTGLHPKFVAYGFIPPHLGRNLSPCAPTPLPICRAQAYVAFGNNGPEIRPAPSSAAWSLPVSEYVLAGLDKPEGLADGWRGLVLLGGSALSLLTTPSWSDTPELRQAALTFLLAEMKKTADEVGARLVVVNIPQPLAKDNEPRLALPVPEELRQAMPARVELIDESPVVAAIPSTVPLRLSEQDGHPSAAVHQAIGQDLGQRFGAASWH